MDRADFKRPTTKRLFSTDRQLLFDIKVCFQHAWQLHVKSETELLHGKTIIIGWSCCIAAFVDGISFQQNPILCWFSTESNFPLALVPAQSSKWKHLTNYHEGELKTTLDSFPMHLVWKVGKANIRRHFTNCNYS